MLRRIGLVVVAALVAVGSVRGQWSVVEEAKLTASNPDDQDLYGRSVAIDGDTVVVGAPNKDLIGLTDVGSVFVHVRSGTSWAQQAQLNNSPNQGERFGGSVAIDGDTIVVGAPRNSTAGVSHAGAAYVFVRTGTTWVQQQALRAPSMEAGARFGHSVAIDGDTVVIGEPLRDSGALESGAAYVFVRTSNTWTLQVMVTISQTNGYLTNYLEFGGSIDIDGDVVAIGAPRALAITSNGSVFLFRRSGTSWSFEKSVNSRGLAPFGSLELFGKSVAVSGDTVIGGAPEFWSWGAKVSGAAHIFGHHRSTWGREALLTKPQFHTRRFGRSVDVEGNTVLVGAPGQDSPSAFSGYSGLAFVYARSGSSWKPVEKIRASDAKQGDRFGASVAISGDTVVVGADYDDHSALSNAGSAYIYRIVPAGPKTYCTAGVSASGCQAAISGIGSPSASLSSGFLLEAQNVEGATTGIFLYGGGPVHQVPWGNGTSYKCIAPPSSSGGPMPALGTLGACDGSFSLDLNALWCPTCPKGSTNPGEGAAVRAQLWYRDPFNTSNRTSSLSDAIVFGVAP